MRILIANDDGIYSPGLATLAKVAGEFGDVRIVAPDVEQSSMGHAITHSRPLSLRRTQLGEMEAWRVNGTPADCVALGVSQWEQVDIVLSGINLGANLGNSSWHSGTLAAAKQAALLGLRGVALSTPVADDQPDFRVLVPWVTRVLELLLPRREFSLVNVNFPPEPRGLRWTRQSVRHYDGQVVPGQDPRGEDALLDHGGAAGAAGGGHGPLGGGAGVGLADAASVGSHRRAGSGACRGGRATGSVRARLTDSPSAD